MARSILKNLAPSLALSSPDDKQPTGHDISTTAGCMIWVVLFIICVIINLGLRLFLAAKYNQRLQRHANAAAFAKPKAGLLPEELSLLPKFVFHPSEDGLALDCSICINQMVDGEMIRVLPACKHFFHVECIDKWLCTHSSCPMCRARPELEKMKLCTMTDEQMELGSFSLKNPPETSAQLDSQFMSTSEATDLQEIRIEAQP